VGGPACHIREDPPTSPGENVSTKGVHRSGLAAKGRHVEIKKEAFHMSRKGSDI